jgi:hypothetical protein
MTYYLPIWIRFAHFINLIFITLLIRSGIEILSALPKLYWHDHHLYAFHNLSFSVTYLQLYLKKYWVATSVDTCLLSCEFYLFSFKSSAAVSVDSVAAVGSATSIFFLLCKPFFHVAIVIF